MVLAIGHELAEIEISTTYVKSVIPARHFVIRIRTTLTFSLSR